MVPALPQIHPGIGGASEKIPGPGSGNPGNFSAFKEQVKINYPILRATQKLVQDYFGDSPISIPTLFTINRKGRIVDVFVGFRPGAVEDSLKKIIE